VLSIYAQLERVPTSLIEAAKNLGADGWMIFRRIILPISVPGIVAGGIITFSLAFGDFVAPVLVGGPDSVMISNVVINLLGVAFDWPLAAAIGLVIITLGLMASSPPDRLARGKNPDPVLRLCIHARLRKPSLSCILAGAALVLAVPLCADPGDHGLFVQRLVQYTGLPFNGFTLALVRRPAVADQADAWGRSGTASMSPSASSSSAWSFGLPAAIALDRYDFPGKGLFRRIVMLPIVLPGIITGVALLSRSTSPST
jgi:ABC-type spermidine/putrescine transport system permease subunit II